MRCTNCRGEHSAFAGACPVMVREKSIQKMMAKEKKSYAVAARSFVGGPQPANIPSGDVSQQSPLVAAGSRGHHLGKSVSTGSQTVKTRSVETQTEPQVELIRSVETQAEPMDDGGAGTRVSPEVASTRVQADICLHCLWWPHLQKKAHHMLEYVDNTGEWRFIENEFHIMQSSSEPKNWFENEERGRVRRRKRRTRRRRRVVCVLRPRVEEEENEEEDEMMKESGGCATAQSGGCWNLIRPP